MGKTRIYVAAASSELVRAELATDWIKEDRAMELAHDWVSQIKAVGQANPRDASELQRYAWSKDIIQSVRGADVLWLLLPEVPTAGAWVELGAAIAFSSVGAGPPKKFVTSGTDDARFRSIFTAYARDHEKTDRGAFATIRMYAA